MGLADASGHGWWLLAGARTGLAGRMKRAYEQRDPALIEMFGNPNLDSLADDPRFQAFLRKMKLPEWPSQTIAAAGT